MSPDRIYRHFCMGARALEMIGDRWTLLIVRDLLLGPLRFTDLQRGLDEITPARLTARLRLLESDGLITRDPSRPGRDVWYSLTKAGRDLERFVHGRGAVVRRFTRDPRDLAVHLSDRKPEIVEHPAQRRERQPVTARGAHLVQVDGDPLVARSGRHGGRVRQIEAAHRPAAEHQIVPSELPHRAASLDQLPV